MKTTYSTEKYFKLLDAKIKAAIAYQEGKGTLEEKKLAAKEFKSYKSEYIKSNTK